ncbi:MAG: hypothetical protein ABR865_11785 [Terracidiphilus sp.]|jgi:hypothetical protein
MSNSTQATLQHIKLLEEEIQALQKRRSELLESGLKGNRANDGWKKRVESLDDQIKILKAQRDRGHTDLANKA